jgi:hypothetical protein
LNAASILSNACSRSVRIGEEFLERLPRGIAANRDAERATTALERKWLANSPLVEAEIAAWFDAETPENETAAAPWLNKAALDDAVYAPPGSFLRHDAYRKSLSGVAQGPMRIAKAWIGWVNDPSVRLVRLVRFSTKRWCEQ